MTVPLSETQVGSRIEEHFPGTVIQASEAAVMVKSDALLDTARFLKTTPGLDFDYLVSVTGVDRIEYFEVVYHLVSIARNHSLMLKTRAYGRDNPAVPSVTSLWRGAELQEREVYDLIGVAFVGHPNLKRVLLWEGFQGHPLRKDFLNLGQRG